MTRTRIIFFAAFVLMLGAGIVIGRLWGDSNRGGDGGGHRPPVFDQLKLTAEQKQQMDAIWTEVKQANEKSFDSRRTIDKQRDQAIQDLFTDTQKQAYEKINADAKAKRAELDAAREKLMRDADERSKAMLDESQRTAWEKMAQDWKQHRRRGPGSPGGGPGGDRGGPDGPGRQGGPGGPPGMFGDRGPRSTSGPTKD